MCALIPVWDETELKFHQINILNPLARNFVWIISPAVRKHSVPVFSYAVRPPVPRSGTLATETSQILKLCTPEFKLGARKNNCKVCVFLRCIIYMFKKIDEIYLWCINFEAIHDAQKRIQNKPTLYRVPSHRVEVRRIIRLSQKVSYYPPDRILAQASSMRKHRGGCLGLSHVTKRVLAQKGGSVFFWHGVTHSMFSPHGSPPHVSLGRRRVAAVERRGSEPILPPVGHNKGASVTRCPQNCHQCILWWHKMTVRGCVVIFWQRSRILLGNNPAIN